MTCVVCGDQRTRELRRGTRDNPYLDILECLGCGLVRLSTFEHISDGHYEDEQMYDGATPQVSSIRDLTRGDDERRVRDLHSLISGRRLLDVGCGAGGFLSLAQNLADLVVGVEPNLSLARSLEADMNIYRDLAQIPSHTIFDVITLFHVLEHLKDPVSTLKSVSKLLDQGGRLVVEVPNLEDALISRYRFERFLDHYFWSNHLHYFTRKTLGMVAKLAGLEIVEELPVQRYGLMNHLGWGDLLPQKTTPLEERSRQVLGSLEVESAYASIVSASGVCDTIFFVLGSRNR